MDYPDVTKSDKPEEVILKTFEQKLEKILSKKDVAAIVTEAGIITGWGSTLIAPKGYLKLVRKLTKKYGTMLILDEVGTGFSRCGKLYGMELENVTPDIATFAKGLSNGAAAIGAMVTTKEVADKTYKITNLTSTFGWVPAACAAALKTLQIHTRDKVWVKTEKDGKYLIEILKQQLKDNSLIKSVHGVGLEIGLTFSKPKIYGKVVDKAREKGLHMVCGDDDNIQIMPPLTIERKNLDKGIEILVKTIRGVKE